jgi:hypothetical protein
MSAITGTPDGIEDLRLQQVRDAFALGELDHAQLENAVTQALRGEQPIFPTGSVRVIGP